MNLKIKAAILLVLAAGVVCGAFKLILGGPHPRKEASPESYPALLEAQSKQLHLALARYKEEYGQMPMGSTHDIIAALFGKNPKGINYLFFPPDGPPPESYFDPWGTPYEIRIQGDTVEIRSAGADKAFNTVDDKVL